MLRHNGNVPSPISDPADSQQEQTRTPWREQPRWLRRVTYAALTLLLVVVGFVVAGAVVIRLPLPDTEGDLKLTGLTSEVKVLRNGQGVPQIYAENTDDLFSRRASCRPRIASGRWMLGVTWALVGSANSLAPAP